MSEVETGSAGVEVRDAAPAEPAGEPAIRVGGLVKRYGERTVLSGISFDLRRGEIAALVGPSGGGKSTALRCMTGLETFHGGTIDISGAQLTPGEGPRRAAELRRVRLVSGMVFQQWHLFPHMTALENVMEGPLSVLGRPRAAAETAARARLARVGLAEKADAYPSQLSGGQQQRVAIARALAMEPEVMLFDEPTSSLDPELVGEVLRTIKALGEDGGTMLLVTHEVGFAFHFATRVLFLHEGRIHEDGPPEQVLKTPREDRTRAFLARFKEFDF